MIPEAKLQNMRVALAARDREIAELRAALKLLADTVDPDHEIENNEPYFREPLRIARAALEAKEPAK